MVKIHALEKDAVKITRKARMGCTGTLQESVPAFGFLPVPIAPWLLAALVLRIGCSLLWEEDWRSYQL